jgi:hypothetical protein
LTIPQVRGAWPGVISPRAELARVSSAIVEGDIFHRSFSIDENARFEGSSRRQETVTDAPQIPLSQPEAQADIHVASGRSPLPVTLRSPGADHPEPALAQGCTKVRLAYDRRRRARPRSVVELEPERDTEGETDRGPEPQPEQQRRAYGPRCIREGESRAKGYLPLK